MKGQSDGFFDRVEVDGKLSFDLRKLQGPVAWKNLWQRAIRRGPLLESTLEKEFTVRHGMEERLALLGAFCLAGRKRAARFLEAWYRGSRKNPEELVFLCLGSASRSLPLSLDFFRSLGSSRKNPSVVRLAAAMALIRRTLPKPPTGIHEWFAERPEGIFVRMLGDQCQVPPSFGPEARAWVFRDIGRPGPREKGAQGLERLAKTLAFLNLAVLPDSLSKKSTLDLLSRESEDREILSLARGRQEGRGSLEDLRADGLSLPYFFSGLQEADLGLQKRILEGPGGARGPAYNFLWWAAGARLISPDQLTAFLKVCGKTPEGRGGELVILQRTLVGDLPLPSLASLREGHPSALRSIFLYLGNRKADHLKVWEKTLSAQTLYALRRLFPPEQGVTPKSAPVSEEKKKLLWELLRAELAPGGLLPGTWKWVHRRFLSRWVSRVFIGGSSFFRRQLGLSPPGIGYLPKGIRGNRDSFFRILSLFMSDYPFFGD